MHGIDDEQIAESGPVYDRIKARLLSQMHPPMQLLQISALADELGTSTTPVREALTRLAAERVIVYLPKKGFFAKTLTEEELRGLYFVNQTLLRSALRGGNESRGIPSTSPSANHSATAALAAAEPENLVLLTAKLFLQIAARSGMNELSDIVSNISDRLHHARLVEQQVVADTREDLLQLEELQRTNLHGELQQALLSYHEKRLQLLSLIYKELLFRPFSSSGRKNESRV